MFKKGQKATVTEDLPTLLLEKGDLVTIEECHENWATVMDPKGYRFYVPVEHLQFRCDRNMPFGHIDPTQGSHKETQVGGDHYTRMTIQPVEFIMKNNLGFVEGAVVKYVSRWKNKGGVEDLRKARHFLNILIEEHSDD